MTAGVNTSNTGTHLHLPHGSLSCRALHKLHKAAALAWRDLCVHYVAIAPKQDAQVLLCYTARQAANEQCGIRGVVI